MTFRAAGVASQIASITAAGSADPRGAVVVTAALGTIQRDSAIYKL